MFAAGDYDLTDQLTLTLGLRYTHEEKAAEIANILRNVDVSCHIVTGPDCPTHFKGLGKLEQSVAQGRADLPARPRNAALCPLDARLPVRRL